jgi:tetratricopeptide (TPR) repeat protein
MGDSVGATADYYRAIQSNHSRDHALSFYNEGNLRRDQHDMAGALADYNTAIELQPSYAEAYLGRGIVKMFQRDIDGAIADYSKAIELRPDFADAYFNRAGLKRDEKGDINGALVDYNRAVELAPNNSAFKKIRYETQLRATAGQNGIIPSKQSLHEAMALDAVGQMKWAKQDLDGAMADFNNAIALDPTFAQAYFDRGRLKALKHNVDGALADFSNHTVWICHNPSTHRLNHFLDSSTGRDCSMQEPNSVEVPVICYSQPLLHPNHLSHP